MNTSQMAVPRPNNVSVSIYEEASGSSAASLDAAAAAPSSILSAVKRPDAPKENALKPGTWTAAKLKKIHASGVQRAPSFTSKGSVFFESVIVYTLKETP